MWNIKKIGYRIYHFLMKIMITILPFPVPKILSGPDSIIQLPTEIKRFSGKKDNIDKVLIVTSPSLIKYKIVTPLCQQLEKENIQYCIFDRVVPDTSLENIEEVKTFYTENNCQAIIAFGGGSVIDCAKVAGARIAAPKKDIKKMEGYFKIPKKLPPFFVIPTTAGTGSEATVAAVVKDRKNNKKLLIGDTKLVPKIAVLDPKTMISLPAQLTATTGMDALTHAIESYIGVHLIRSTKRNAEKAVKMIFDNLEEAYNNGKNIEARTNMAWASFYAGLAFTRSSVGYVHNIAHQLGGIYGVPHGLANGIILPYVLQYYGKSIDKRLAQLAVSSNLCTKKTPRSEAAKIFLEKITSLNTTLNIPTFIKEIETKDIETIAKRAIKEGNPVSPVPKIMNETDCEKIIVQLIKS